LKGIIICNGLAWGGGGLFLFYIPHSGGESSTGNQVVFTFSCGGLHPIAPPPPTDCQIKVETEIPSFESYEL